MQTNALHGIKALCHLVIILLHACVFGSAIYGEQWESYWHKTMPLVITQFIGHGGLYAVDILFLVTGYFCAKEWLANSKGYFLFVVNRIWRMGPTLWFCSLLVLYILPNNKWNIVYDVFMVQNYFTMRQACFGIVWSICCDVQFFAVAFLVAHVLRKRFGFALLFAMSIAIRYYHALQVDRAGFHYKMFGFSMEEEKMHALMDYLAPLMDALYYRLHTRYISFVCGFYIAMQQQERPANEEAPKQDLMLLLLAWNVVVACFAYPMTSQHEYSDLYFWFMVLKHPMFALAAMYILYPYFYNVNGNQTGLSYVVLKLPLWRPINEVMLASYLMHSFVLIIVMLGVNRVIPYISLVIPSAAEPSLLVWCVCFVLCTIISIKYVARWIFLYVEVPCNAYRQKVIGK